MINHKWKAYIDTKDWQGTRDLYITGLGLSNQRIVIEPLIMTDSPYGKLIDKPTLSETREEVEDNCSPVAGILQAMLDAAWKLGMRPEGYDVKDSNAEIAAIRYHLEDMRLLAKVRK